MGNTIHTPKTIYKKGLVVEFNVKNKVVYYKISRWTKEGTDQGSLAEGKLSEFKNPQDVMDYAWIHYSCKEAQQKFGDVIRQ